MYIICMYCTYVHNIETLAYTYSHMHLQYVWTHTLSHTLIHTYTYSMYGRIHSRIHLFTHTLTVFMDAYTLAYTYSHIHLQYVWTHTLSHTLIHTYTYSMYGYIHIRTQIYTDTFCISLSVPSDVLPSSYILLCRTYACSCCLPGERKPHCKGCLLLSSCHLLQENIV